MKEEIEKEVTQIYEKIQKETTQNLKKYNESLKEIKRETKRSWALIGIKEAFFWSICIAMLINISGNMVSAYSIEMPLLIWQIAYPLSLIPLIGYAIQIIVKIIREE
jgi:hypothetical protein